MIVNTGSRRALAAVLAVSLMLASTACVATPSSKSQAKGKAPAWMLDLDASYPKDKYLAAAGSGDAQRGAESDAAGALARVFNVNVKADSTATQRYQQIVQGGASSSQSEMQVTQTVGMKSGESLVNMHFSDPYSDSSGLVHIVAYLEREPTAAIYRAAIGKDTDRVDGFLSRAAASGGSALQAFALYDAAYQVGLNVERMLSQLRIIHAKSAILLENSVELPKIAASRDAAAAKLSYSLSIEGDTDGKIAGFVREALSAQSLSFKADGALSVRGSWTVEPVPNAKYKAVRWSLSIALYDEGGSAIANVVKESRESAISDTEALALAYREARKSLSKAMADSLQDYLTRAVIR
jgi:hypothetical protein